MKTKQLFCKIMRTKVIHDEMTGQDRVVSVPCGNWHEVKSGVCDSCRKGWEVEGNRFSSVAEMMRAREKHK